MITPLSSSSGTPTLLFRGSVDRKEVSIFSDVEGKIRATIKLNGKISNGFLKGIPPTTNGASLQYIRYLLGSESHYRLIGSTLNVTPKLRGGGNLDYISWLPMFLLGEPLLAPRVCKYMLKTLYQNRDRVYNHAKTAWEYGGKETLLATGTLGLAYATGGGSLALTAAGPALLGWLKGVMDNATFIQYQRKVDAIESQTLSMEEKLNELHLCFQDLGQDLDKIPNLDQKVAQQFRALAVTRDVQALRTWTEAGAFLLSFKDPEAAGMMRVTVHTVADCFEASNQLSMLDPLAPLSARLSPLGAVALALAKMGAHFLGMKFDSPDSMTLAAVQEVFKEVQELRKEHARSAERTEQLIIALGLSLTNQISQLSSQMTTGFRVLSNQISQVKNALNTAYTDLDRTIVGLSLMTFDNLVASTISFSSQISSPADRAILKRDLLQIFNWARVNAQDPRLTGTSQQRVNIDIRVLSSAAFKIGYLNTYLSGIRQFSQLCHPVVSNPTVLANAADAYINIRVRTSQLDSDLDTPQHRKELKEIYDNGIETLQFIRGIQKEERLFKDLLGRYKQNLKDLQQEFQANASFQAASVQALLLNLESNYNLLQGFIQLGFSRSWGNDPFFASLLKPQTILPHYLFNRNEIESVISKALQSPRKSYELSLLWEQLQEVADMLEGCLMQKIESLKAETTDEQYLFLALTLNNLALFWRSVYSNEPPLSLELLKIMPYHQTDVEALFLDPNSPCYENFFLAAKLGLISIVVGLMDRGRYGVNDQHPVTGRTALHEAVRYGHAGLVDSLLSRQGIKSDQTDKGGKTPKDEVSWVKDSDVKSRIDKKLQFTVSLIGKTMFFREAKPKGIRVSDGGIQYVKVDQLAAFTDQEKTRFPKADPSDPPRILGLRNFPARGTHGSWRSELSTLDLTTGAFLHVFKVPPNTGILDVVSLPGCTAQQPNFHIVTQHLQLGAKAVRVGGEIATWKWQGGQSTKMKTFNLSPGHEISRMEGDRAIVSYTSQTEVIDLVSGSKFSVKYAAGTTSWNMWRSRLKSFPYLLKNKLVAPYKTLQSRMEIGIWDITQGTTPIATVNDVRPFSSPSFQEEGKVAFVGVTFEGQLLRGKQLKIFDLETNAQLPTLTFPGAVSIALLKYSVAIVAWRNVESRRGEVTGGISFYDIYSGSHLQTIPHHLSSDLTIEGNTLISYGRSTHESAMEQFLPSPSLWRWELS